VNTDMEKSSYSAFERFLYWFFIPIVFTVVLISVLLSLFDYDIMNSMLKVAHKIPIVGTLLPQPKTVGKLNTKEQEAVSDKTKEQESEDVLALKKIVSQKDELLKNDEATFQQKDQALKDMQAKYTLLEEQLKTKAKSDEEYHNQVVQTSAMYAKMNPSKSAPIIESLTLKERVLILSEMKPDDRVKILEKMDVKKAAEASIYLKDVVPAKDREIAALQERIKLNDETNAPKLTKNDIGQTFANMTPKSAATVLLEMQVTNAAKVIDILSSMDTPSRSKIMSAIADLSKETAASISTKLSQNAVN
jgi:flagellar motility protein MotE (MotC chaperone)